MERLPAIGPDYTQTTLPPNIAPMPFTIKEKGAVYYVRISSEQGKPIDLLSRSPHIRIPIKPWKTLLEKNRGRILRIAISIQDEKGQWCRFSPIENPIAAEPIDSHLVYRIIKPLYMYHDQMDLVDRDLTGFEERPMISNTATGGNCINCHSFHQYNPDRMMFHMRAGAIGTSMILAYDGRISKVDTKTSFNPPAAYRSWHPNGRIIAFSHNAVRQVFHATGENRNVYDRASDIFLYDIQTQTITTSGRLADPNRLETYPEWSPDGRTLYFCAAPGLDRRDGREHPYDKIRYDLVRISYDARTGAWGEEESVVKAGSLGLSAAHPKISPDGRTLLFCMSNFSNFPLYRPESDLYLLDIRTNEWSKAESLNSDRAESYHAWSSNGRWVVFSSKRQDGLSTHLYISYFDAEGHFSKPFLLPQRDPDYHEKLPIVYNVPEFVKGPLTIPPQRLIEAAWSRQVVKARLDPTVGKRSEAQPIDTSYPSFHGN